MSKSENRGKRSARDYGRPRRFEISAKKILIVTEGKNTEINYFKALRTRLKLSATDIQVIHPEGTDPVTLTQEAVRLRNLRKKNDPQNPYDEVWVVFDLEKQYDERRRKAKKAREIPGAKGIQFIESDPSFEYWRLLHEPNGYTTRFFHDCDSVQKELKKHCPAYSKSEIPNEATLNQIPTAVERAKRCRKHHEESGGNGNPSTNVDLLVRSMNGSTRMHLQFPLPPE